jgi:hypothetical protein
LTQCRIAHPQQSPAPAKRRKVCNARAPNTYAQGETERAPFPRSASQGNHPAHQLHDTTTDGKPKTCPAVLSGCRFVSLRKGAEDRFMLVFRNANTGVAHRNIQKELAALLRTPAHDYLDLTVFGEFDGIANEVGQHLAQAGWITQQDSRHIRSHGVEALHPFW